MAELHTATGSPLVDDLVADTVAFVRERGALWLPQIRVDHRDSANRLLYEVWTDMQGHLQIPFAITVASHQLLTQGGEP